METTQETNQPESGVVPGPARINIPQDIGVEAVTPPEPTNGAPAAEDVIDPTKEVVELVLDHPIDFDGKHYERLVLNLIGIRRKQWKSIKKTFRGLDSSFNPMPLDDEDYQAVVAAEAAQVPLLLLDALHPTDWLRVSGVVFQFLGKSLDPRATRPRR